MMGWAMLHLVLLCCVAPPVLGGWAPSSSLMQGALLDCAVVNESRVLLAGGLNGECNIEHANGSTVGSVHYGLGVIIFHLR